QVASLFVTTNLSPAGPTVLSCPSSEALNLGRRESHVRRLDSGLSVPAGTKPGTSRCGRPPRFSESRDGAVGALLAGQVRDSESSSHPIYFRWPPTPDRLDR